MAFETLFADPQAPTKAPSGGPFDNLFGDTPPAGSKSTQSGQPTNNQFQTVSSDDWQKSENAIGSARTQGYGVSNLKDPSSDKFYLTYENPGAKSSQLLKDRVAPSFDFTKAQKMDQSMLTAGRMPESVSQPIKDQMGGGYSDELDHKIALELSGSNDQSNLQISLGRNTKTSSKSGFDIMRPSTWLPSLTGSTSADQDKLENDLAHKVTAGQISLLDAQRQLARAKAFTLTEDKGKAGTSSTDPPIAPLMLPNTFKGLSDLQTDPLSTGGSIKEFEKAGEGLGQSISDELKNATDLVTSFTGDRSAGQKVGSAIRVVTGAANVPFSVISSVLNMAAQIPGIGTIAKLAALPMQASTDVISDAVDIYARQFGASEETKKNLVEPIKELLSTVAQYGVAEILFPDGKGTEKISNDQPTDQSASEYLLSNDLTPRGISGKDNISSLDTMVRTKVREYRSRSLGMASGELSLKNVDDEFAPLESRILKYLGKDDLASIHSLYNNAEHNATEFANTIRNLGFDEGVIDIKRPESIAKKIAAKRVEIASGKSDRTSYNTSDVNDVVRGSVIVDSPKAAESLLGKLQSEGKVVSSDNYFTKEHPAKTGYQGINTDLKMKDGSLAELQIHTPDSWDIKKRIDAAYEASKDERLLVFNESDPQMSDLDRAGFVNPVEFLNSLSEEFQKAKERKDDRTFGQKLRTFFVGERDFRIARENQKVMAWQKTLKDTADREAITLLRDFAKKPGELQQFLDGTHPFYDKFSGKEKTDAINRVRQLAGVIYKAMNPTDAMKRVSDAMTIGFDQSLAEGKKLGFLDSNIDREEYITHLLYPREDMETATVKKGGGLVRGKIGRFTPFSKERYYPTMLHAIADGLTPKTLDATTAYSIYWDKHATAAATRMLVNFLKDNDIAKWGFKSQLGDQMPANWVELAPESHLFRNTLAFNDEDGNPQVAYQTLYVPEKVRDALRPMTDPDYTKLIPGFRSSRLYQAYIKSMELGLSFFHLKSETLMGYGNEGLTGVAKSYQSDMFSPRFLEAERNFVKAGGQTPILGRTIEAYRSLEKTSIPTRGDILRNMPGLKQLDQIGGKIAKLTFDITQRKLKVTDFSLKDAKWIADHPGATDAEHFDAQRSIASQVNAVYGGLNWEVLGVNKMTLNLTRWFVLAPDWTYSNFLNIKQSFEGGPAGSASRMFWIRSVVAGIVMSELTSKFLSGQKSNDPFSVYLGKDKNGKDVYQNMFFGGAPGDAVNMWKDIAQYGFPGGFFQWMIGKASPAVRTALIAGTGRNFLGQQINPKGTNPIAASVRTTEAVAGSMAPLPFSLQNLYQMFYDPNKQYSMEEYLTTLFAGTRPRHLVPSGMRVITSGKRKGQLTKDTSQPQSIMDQIKTGKPHKPKRK